MRIFVLAVAALILVGTIPGLIGLVRASDGTLNPPHSDYAVDTSFPPNGLYEQLIVNVSVDVTVAGMFIFMVDLYDNSDSFWIDGQFSMPNLPLGPQSVTFTYPGFTIRSSGYDGPYQVRIMMLDDMGLLLGTGSHTTGPYLATEFEYPPGTFKPPHSDRALDTDNDTLYDYLIISANITTNASDTYSVGCDLFDITGMIYIGSAINGSLLPVGNHTLDVSLQGWQIRASGIDGPYRVEMYLLDGMMNMMDNNTYFTGPYMATNFTNPPAQFEPPHSDYGLDTNGNMLYEYLVVDVSVNVTVDGPYTIFGFCPFGVLQVDTFLTAGLHTVELRFLGSEIFNFGIDGPYMINLELRDDMFNLLDTDMHMTAPYFFTDFEPNPPAAFSPPHSDYGLDTSFPPDGIFEFLVVNASIQVNDPGMYLVQAMLFDPMMMPIAMIQEVANLSAGPGNVTLQFSGIDINRNGLNGTFTVMMDLMVLGPMGPPISIDNDWYFTNFYNYTDFVSLPVSPLWGYVYDGRTGSPLFMGEVTAVNYSYGWMMRLQTDPSGYYEFSAFDGDFVVIMDDSDLQAVLSPVTVLGSTEVTRTLDVPPPGEMNTDLTFSDWDNAVANTTGFMADDNQSIRFMIDYMYGNKNAYLDQSEADWFISMMGGGFQPNLSSTEDMLYVDGIHYDLVPGTDFFSFDMTGPVASTNPFTMSIGGDYTSNSTIPVAATHLMEINNTYDSIDEMGWFSGLVPAGWYLEGYDPVPNVVVSGWATPSFVIDPLMDPDPMDTIDWVWANLTFGQGPPDGNAPQTLSVTINGLAAPTYGISTLPPVLFINATIDDTASGNIPIGGANFTEGQQNWGLSWPMSATDGTFDTPVEDVTGTIVSPPLGMTFYCVYGWDAVPNFGTTDVCASLTINDDAGPDINSILIDGAPTSTYLTSALPAFATLTATIDDTFVGGSTIVVANYTAPLIDSWPSTPMNPVDGAFDGPTEDVNISILVPVVAGTYDYFVHAWDANGNRNDTAPAVQIIVVDDEYPMITFVRLNGVGSPTVFPGDPVTVEALVTDSWRGDSFIAGANYTIEAQNWSSSTPMNPSDGLFDEVSEMVTSAPGTLDTTAWSDGVYQICVYVWDITPNNNTVGDCATLTISSFFVDDERPWVYGVTLNNGPGVTVAPGSIVFLNATIDDTLALGSNIQGANYSVDGAWNDANVLYPMDGAFDSPLEDVNTTINTTGWSGGTYNICVSGWDDAPNYNSSFFVMACAQLTIISPGDTQPPLIANVLLDGQATPLTVIQGATVILTATIHDNTTGGSDILDASYTVNMTGPNIVMFATDGSFDSDVETVNASINTAGWADSSYMICVHGSDIVPNQHSAFDACIQLIVQIPPDTSPPTISNVLADPDPAAPGETVRISASVNDDVGVSEVRIKIWTPSGSEVANAPMSYDSGNDEYYYSYADNDEGTYTFEINATDTSSNSAVETGSYDVHEQTPPTIDVTVSDESPEVGDTIAFEADVEDDSDIDDVRITIRDPDGTTVVNSRPMTEDGGVYVYEYEVDEAGDFTYTITATDEHGNSDDTSGTFSVSESGAPSFFEEYWWLILIIVIIVVVLLVVGLLRRKPQVQEFGEPEPEMEAPPTEEPVEPPMEEPVEEFLEEPSGEPEEPPTDEMAEEPPPPDDLAEDEVLDEVE